ncbi:MAG: hypothetical protein LBL84_00740 [Candidatus Nomurabacteria bacterium]|jgi:hypothetical protein|nr:hypothetical protein [Candidatus Nomurabacteria bacterium]
MSTKAKVISVVLALVAAYVVLCIIALQKPHEGAIRIVKTPTNADVYIDDKKVGDEVVLEVGKEYHVVGKKSGWKNYDKKITVHEYDKNIPVALEPDSEEAERWLKEHDDNSLSRESAAGENAASKGKYLENKYPIINSLSYKGSLFTVTYGYDTPGDDDSFYVLVDSPYGFYSDGIKKIYDLGYDPGNYTIKFNDFKNPFEAVKDD